MSSPAATAFESFQAAVEHVGLLLSARLEADPFRTFLALVAAYLISIVAFSWLMISWLQPGGSGVERRGERKGGKKE